MYFHFKFPFLTIKNARKPPLNIPIKLILYKIKLQNLEPWLYSRMIWNTEKYFNINIAKKANNTTITASYFLTV